MSTRTVQLIVTVEVDPDLATDIEIRDEIRDILAGAWPSAVVDLPGNPGDLS